MLVRNLLVYGFVYNVLDQLMLIGEVVIKVGFAHGAVAGYVCHVNLVDSLFYRKLFD